MMTWFKTIGWKLAVAAAAGSAGTIASQWIIGKLKSKKDEEKKDEKKPDEKKETGTK